MSVYPGPLLLPSSPLQSPPDRGQIVAFQGPDRIAVKMHSIAPSIDGHSGTASSVQCAVCSGLCNVVCAV